MTNTIPEPTTSSYVLYEVCCRTSGLGLFRTTIMEQAVLWQQMGFVLKTYIVTPRFFTGNGG